MTELWNTTQVAQFLGIKPSTVSAYRHRGQMPAPTQTLGARTHLWDAATIRAWYAQRPRMDLTQEAKTNYAVAPGEYVTEWLEEQHMDPTTLAWRLGVPDAYVAQLLAGKIVVSQPLQTALEDITGIPADSWRRLEAQYWKDKARLEEQ